MRTLMPDADRMYKRKPVREGLNKAVLFPAVRVSLIYTIAGVLWIVVSDKLLLSMVSDPHTITILQTYKGWAFVLASSLLIYHFLIRELRGRMQAEESLGIALEAARFGYWDLDLVENRTHRSIRHDQIFGYQSLQPEWNHEIFLKHVLPEDRVHVAECFSRALAQGDLTLDCRIRWPDQTIHWIECRGRAYLGKDGRPVRVVGVVTDATERKRGEEALRESESKYRTLVENIPQKIFVKDRDSVYLSCNESFARDLGIGPDQCIGKTDYDFFPRELAQKYRADDKRIMEAGQTEELEEKYLQAGQEVWVQTIKTPIRQGDGTIIGILGIFWDITDHKKAENALRESEEKFAAMFRYAPNPMVVSSLEDGTLIEVNDAFVTATGYERSEVLGKAAIELGIWKDADERSSWLEQIKSKGYARNVDLSFTRKDGRLRQGLHSTVTIQLQGKQSLLSTVNDITERKRAEEALKETEARFRALSENTFEAIFLSEKGICTGQNLAAEKMFGYSTEEAIGRPGTDWIAPEHREIVRQNIVLDYAPPYEVLALRKDGMTFSCEIQAKMISDDERRIRVTSLRDITDRKKSEQALRESEERLRLAWETIPDPLSITRMDDGTYVDVNSGHSVLSGCSREEVLGRSSLDIPIWHAPEARQLFVSRLKRDGHVKNFEAKLRRREGEPRTFLVSASQMTLNGEPHILAVARDVEELHQTVEALGASEEKYRNIFDNSIEGIFQTSPDGRFISANPALARMFGYASPEEMISDVTDLGHQLCATPQDRDEAKRRLDEGVPVTGYQIELCGRDGTNFWVSINARSVRDEMGNVLYYEGTMEDITDRKRAEEELKESEQRYRSLFEESRDGVYSVLRDGEITDANTSFCEIFGYTREEIIGNDIRELYLDPAEHPRFQKEIEENGFVKDYEVKFRKRDGAEIDCLLTSSVHLGEDGSIAGYRGILRDLTAHKALHRQLLQAQKMEAIGTLAGGIAHDFNNLLNIVMGFSELLLAEKKHDHPDYADLQKIFYAAKNGAELVGRLLMFSRKAEPKPVPMNLNKQILQVEKLLGRTIPRMINIRLELSPNLPEINADPSQIEQVLINLAVNARDAMRDSGTLTVKTNLITLDEEYCRLHVEASPDEYIVLEVSDTGHGMDKETVEHIFEPFFTTKEMGRGTGLGLAIVYGIVKQLKGHITVNSEVGKGTTFRVHFPVIQAVMEPDVVESGMMPVAGTETVLVVDDEEFLRELGARILTKHGYTVLQAENGRDALDLFKEERSKISLVILDLIMPKMGGTECLKRLLEIDAQVNVLVASGLPGDASVKEAIQMGAKGFISKPFRIGELLREIRRVLDKG